VAGASFGLSSQVAGRGRIQPSEIGDPAASSYLGLTSPYYINNGKIVTETLWQKAQAPLPDYCPPET
jgi:hypothetical protein